MLETGRINRLPVKYRMLLALSVALLVHTLIAAALSLMIPVRQPPQKSSLDVTLVRSGLEANSPSSASTPAASPSSPRQTTQAAASSKPQPTTQKSPQSVSRPAQPKPEPAPARPRPSQRPAVASEPDSRQGAHSPVDGNTDESMTQVTPPTPAKKPSYADTLVVQIAKEAGRETLKIPNQTAREGLKPLQLELKLMSNGTLVRADIIQSTGIKAYDQSILRAALRASPFPEPPRDERQSDLRFRITFYLKPDR